MRKQGFGLDPGDPSDIVQILQQRLVKRWSTTEELLDHTDGRWLMGGEDPSFADLAAMPPAVRIPQWTPDLAPHPARHTRVADWLEALRSRSSVAEVDRQGEPAPSS